MSNFLERVVKLYYDEDMSTYEIAKELNTYANKVRRTLLKNGYELKNKSDAQRAALESGRAEHPTRGKKRTEYEKIKISGGLVDYWDRLSEEEKEKRNAVAKKNWDNMSSEDKEKMRQKAVAAIRAAAVEGSKMEKLFKKRLEKAGYEVELHKEVIPTEGLEIDLYLPKIKTIIEIDGPSHFLPIWGEEKLNKQINADLRKTGLLLTKGFVIIRVKCFGQESIAKREELISQTINHVKNVEKNRPEKSKSFIEVE